METDEKFELLWKTLIRYDFYINSTNSKATVLLAFNTFILSGLILKWTEFFQIFDIPWLIKTATILLGIISVAAVVSLFLTIFVINPFLKSPRRPKDYHSSIFFGHVAEYSSAEDYLVSIQSQGPEDIIKDLSFQTHIVAQGIDKKFKCMKYAFYPVLFVIIPSIFILILCKILAMIYS